MTKSFTAGPAQLHTGRGDSPDVPQGLQPDRIGAWAEVRANDQVMRYRRCGVGPTVLLLRAGDDPASLWPELVDALACEFRVVVPELPSAGSSVAAWLADFLDGLGAAPAAIVAADRQCMGAIELVLLSADRVAGIVLVPSGLGIEPALDGALATPERESRVPVLLVPRGLAAARAVPLVAGFLASTGSARAL
jgi:pimeloyl-ACP methyl ester carboxylesterase